MPTSESALQIKSPARREKGLVLLCVLGVFALKAIYLLLTKQGPMTFPDETIYAQSAAFWFNAEHSLITKYPPVTALLLSPAYLFSEHWYTAMVLLGAFYATLSLYPIYLIARLHMPRAQSALATFLCALTPVQYIFPRMTLSENPYLLILMTCAYLVLKVPAKRAVFQDVCLGILGALLILTRFITLVTLPVFFALWWLRPEGAELPGGANPGLLPTRRKLLRLGALFLAFVSVYGAWVLYSLHQGVPFLHTLGFHISQRSSAEQRTLFRLARYILVYLAYYALIAAPVLGLLLGALKGIRLKNIQSPLSRLLLLSLGLALVFMVATVRHSWRVYYNAYGIHKLMGRYLTYFPTLFYLSAFAFLYGRTRVSPPENENAKANRSLIWQFLWFFGVSASYMMYRIMLARVIGERGGIDVYRILQAPPWLYLGLTLACLLLLWRLRYAKGGRVLQTLAFALLVLWQMAGAPQHQQALLLRESQAILPRALSSAIESQGHARRPADIVLMEAPEGTAILEESPFRRSMQFWNTWAETESALTVSRPGSPLPDTARPLYVVCPKDSPPTDAQAQLLKEVDVSGKAYHIYLKP